MVRLHPIFVCFFDILNNFIDVYNIFGFFLYRCTNPSLFLNFCLIPESLLPDESPSYFCVFVWFLLLFVFCEPLLN